MASKAVQPLEIILGIKGAEKLAGLKSSFRDLTKTVKLTDSGLKEARQGIIEYAASANQSEALIRGQIKAFEALREQAAMGGEVYRGLSSDITELKAQLNGSTSAIDAQRKSLLENAGSAKVTQAQLLSVANALSILQQQTALGSKAFVELGNDIASLQGKIAKVKAEQQDLQRVTLAGNQAAAGGATATRLQIRAIDEKVASLREEKRVTEELSRQGKIRLGMQGLLDTFGPVPFRSREYIERAVAPSLLGEDITTMFGAKELQSAIDLVQQSVAELQNQVEVELGRSARRAFQEMAREGRESARSLALAFSGPEFERIFSNLERNVGELPNTTAGLSQRLRELERVLNNTERSSVQYRRVSEEISRVQKELAKDVYSYSEALENLARKEEAAARRRSKLASIGEYFGAVSALGTEAAAGRTARGGTPVVADPGGYRDPATGAIIASGRGMRRDRLAYQEAQEMEQIADLQKVVNGLADEHVESLRSALRTMDEYEQKLGDDIVRKYEEATAAQQKAAKEEAAREEKEYQRRMSIVRQMKTGETASRRLIGLPREELSGLYSGIVQIGQADQSRQIEMMGRSYDRVADDIRKVTAASNGSISSLNAQRSSWASLRNILNPSSEGFREATKEIERLDRALEKTQRRRRRMSPMQMTQTAGAVLSGGIFGGPEGFLGGAIGAIGGVGGAFAGAAIGAQVGGLRRQLGEFADYAAEIKRLEIALKGITEVQDDAVASQANYSRAVAAAADVTKDLNVPQEVAIRGITRLTAAVKGAGGGVADAELAFKNITSAITATGGGAEQVQGAVTALVQIFSKGKVSAEEINQIAERLPGTFNKIAEASGRTGPELTKALQDGEVGLNDLMKFLVQLGGEYGELAEKIAGSSEAAGQRLQVAYNNMRIEVGNALQPIGAEFQDAFTEFIKDITPTLVELLPKIGEFALALAGALDPANSLALEVAGVATAVFLLKKAVDGYIGTKFAAIITTHIALINTMGAKIYTAAAAQGVLNAALGVGKALLASLPVVTVFLGVLGLADALRQAATDQANFNKLLNEGTVDQLNNALATEKATLALERRFVAQGRGEGRAVNVSRIKRSQKKIEQLEEALAEGMLGGGTLPLDQPEPTLFKTTNTENTELDRVASAMANAEKFGVQLGRTLEDLRSKIAGVGDTAIEAISRRYADALRKADKQADDNIKAIVKLEKESGKLYPGIKESIEEVRDASKELAEAIMFEDIGKHFKQAIERAQQPLNNLMESFNTQIRERARVEELMSKGMNKSLAEQIANIETIAAKEDEVLRKKIAQLETELLKSELSDEEKKRLKEKIELLKQELELTPGRKEKAITGAKSLEEKEDTPANIITKGFDDAKESLEDLVNLGNIAVNSANMIGDAFGKAFADVVTGSATAKEALAGMMQSIGQSFIQMAAKIIAKQTTMIILGSIAKALGLMGGAAGFESAPLGEGFTTGASASSFDAVGAGIFTPKASGGPVKGNRPYLVGERGPELFVPGSNGGVMRNEDLRSLMGRSPAAANTSAMNFTFETTSIGGTEYVSREQLEAAMATTRRQAASDGAKRGMNMTLDRMQNSPRTRSRVGIS